ncbi:MAG: hypothetical protein JXL81_10325 [Deltaproteobacteria bacterium]|nr:hypothetical protein [Deltaproteobacteria bacterium]
MAKMKRKITTRETGIFEFINGLEKILYLIPPFQREFVWEPCDIIRHETLFKIDHAFRPVNFK